MLERSDVYLAVGQDDVFFRVFPLRQIFADGIGEEDIKNRMEVLGELFSCVAGNGKEDITSFFRAFSISGLAGEWESGRITELEAKVREYETASAKTRIARETGLPIDLADRISGDNEDAMRADAESLAKLLKSQQAPVPIYRPSGEGANDGKDAALKGLLQKVREQ
jgi:hypothetical protein